MAGRTPYISLGNKLVLAISLVLLIVGLALRVGRR
jgi:hypothetical protein